MKKSVQEYFEKIIFITLPLAFVLPVQVNADCNMCTKAERACLSETTYQYCSDGTINEGDPIPCPNNRKCDLNAECVAEDTMQGPPSCTDCGKCNSEKTFACITTTTFALCLGKDKLSPIEGTCSEGFVCSINSPYICAAKTENGATCSYTDDPTTTTTTSTTTPSPATHPNEFCKKIKTPGRYPVGVDPATSCKEYVQCINYNGNWLSPTYVCPGGNYFDDVKGVCTKDTPTRCLGRVRNLKILDLELP